MKRWLGIGLLSIFITFLRAQDDGQAQRDHIPDVNERVEVLNVEMIARVQKNGQLLGGLHKEDFILTENGRKMEINGFREVRRCINAPPANEEKAAAVQPLAGRLFALCFWVRGHEAECVAALDLFFRDIYRPGDNVLLAHTEDTFLILSPDEIAPVRARFEAGLREDIKRGNQARREIFDEVDRAIWEYENRPGREDPALARYRRDKALANCRRQFKVKFLESDPASLTRLADSLKPIRREKWVLVFLQEEVFPGGSSRWGGITAFTEKVRSSFIAADTTVNLIRLGFSALADYRFSRYYEQKTAYSSRDECFQLISRFTGGATINDVDLPRALKQAANKEDVSYVISFAPEDFQKKRNVHLTCRDKDAEVLASRRIYSKDPYEMTISDASITNSQLSFTLSGYARLFEGRRLQGRVLVRVTTDGAGSANAESSREFTPTDPVVKIPVSLSLPGDPPFKFTIRVLDRISGREAVKQITLRNQS